MLRCCSTFRSVGSFRQIQSRCCLKHGRVRDKLLTRCKLIQKGTNDVEGAGKQNHGLMQVVAIEAVNTVWECEEMPIIQKRRINCGNPASVFAWLPPPLPVRRT